MDGAIARREGGRSKSRTILDYGELEGTIRKGQDGCGTGWVSARANLSCLATSTSNFGSTQSRRYQVAPTIRAQRKSSFPGLYIWRLIWPE